jgi:dCMP deaminase
MKPNKDIVYLKIAYDISSLSYCTRKQVGAVIVKDDNIIAIGYNGTPSGFENVCEIDNITKPEVLHAESNAIAKCARSVNSSEGATMYTTWSPCFACAKLIIQAGIKRVVFGEYYNKLDGLDLLAQANIDVELVTLKDLL